MNCSYNNSSLSSVALNALKNVYFDLAAQASSIGGVGSHPRFLVHDGPRGSDLPAAISELYFLYAGELEQKAEDILTFQYIITTTEPRRKSCRNCHGRFANLMRPEERLLKWNL